MPSLSPGARRERLLRKFQITGDEGASTRLFESFPPSIQEFIRAAAGIRTGEEPILASYRHEETWTLLTTHRLIARQGSLTTDLGWSEIVDATVHLSAARAELHEDKLQLHRLWIIRADGSRLELELEPGPSFIAFWNVMKTVARLTAEESATG